MKQPHKHADIIKAWADGAEIEVRNNSGDNWEDINVPGWFNCLEYRIKPTPVITKRYSFYDRIERYVADGRDLNNMRAQFWYDTPDTKGGMLEWTFTDGKLTSINILGEE